MEGIRLNMPFIYALLASLCYGIASLFEKKGLELTTATDALLLRAGFVTLLMVAYSIGMPHGMARSASLNRSALLLIFAGAFFGVLLAQLFYFKSLEIGNISTVVPLVNSMQIVVSVSLALLVYHEPVSLQRLGGIALMIAGIFLIR